MAERLERGMWSGGRLIGARDLPARFSSEPPVVYGEDVKLTFEEVIDNAVKPPAMTQREWDIRLGVVKMLAEFSTDIDLKPLNDITESTAGPHMASSFSVKPLERFGISGTFTVDTFPLWNYVTVESAAKVRTQISIGPLLRTMETKDADASRIQLARAKADLRSGMIKAASAKPQK